MTEPARTPLFSVRHYEMIAEAVGSSGLTWATRQSITDSLIRMFMLDNPDFDYKRFCNAVFLAEPLGSR